MEDNIKNASAILRREHLAKILRIYDFFSIKENRKQFAEQGYSYSKISRVFQMNGIELEAVMEYVCKYSRSNKNKPVCEVIAKAKEMKSHSKKTYRVDKNKDFVNDTRIDEIDKLFNGVFTEEGEIKEELSNKDFLLLKEELFEEIDKRVKDEVNRQYDTPNTSLPIVDEDTTPTITETPQVPINTPKEPIVDKQENFNPNEYLSEDEKNKEIETPQTHLDTTIEDALVKEHDYKELEKKLKTQPKKSKKKIVILMSFFILVVAFFFTVYTLFSATVEIKKQPTLKLPSNLSALEDSDTSISFEKNDAVKKEPLAIEDKVVKKVSTLVKKNEDLDKEDKLNQIIENQREFKEQEQEQEKKELEEKELIAKAELIKRQEQELIAKAELIKRQEQELIAKAELIKRQEQEIAKLEAIKEQRKKDRINKYTTIDIKNAQIKQNGFSINQDFFRVGDKLGKFIVLAIRDEFIDVFNNEEGYPFKIYTNEDK